MKVGSLVSLSSYGAKRQFNHQITRANENNVGIIVNITERATYPYEVMWSCYLGPNYADPGSRRDRHSRRELKIARVK